jgi:hypothetical protein
MLKKRRGRCKKKRCWWCMEKIMEMKKVKEKKI